VTNDLLQELRFAVQATVASETQTTGKGKSTGAPRTQTGGALASRIARKRQYPTLILFALSGVTMSFVRVPKS
jgi:hypothetical protein